MYDKYEYDTSESMWVLYTLHQSKARFSNYMQYYTMQANCVDGRKAYKAPEYQLTKWNTLNLQNHFVVHEAHT